MLYDEWLNKLRHQRLYRQHEIAYGTRDAPRLTDVATPVEDLTPITSPVSPSKYLKKERDNTYGLAKDCGNSSVLAI